METPTPTTNPPPAHPPIGTFVQQAASFFVRPTADQVDVWRRHVPAPVRNDIESYVMIKLLASEESATLRVEMWPEVLSIIGHIGNQLVQQYLREISERRLPSRRRDR